MCVEFHDYGRIYMDVVETKRYNSLKKRSGDILYGIQGDGIQQMGNWVFNGV